MLILSTKIVVNVNPNSYAAACECVKICKINLQNLSQSLEEKK